MVFQNSVSATGITACGFVVEEVRSLDILSRITAMLAGLLLTNDAPPVPRGLVGRVK